MLRITLPSNKWNTRKHGGPKRRLWRKIHIGIDEETLEIRAVEATSNGIGDAPMLPDLLNQIPRNQGTRQCHCRWRLQHPQMLQCDRSPKCPCRDTAA